MPASAPTEPVIDVRLAANPVSYAPHPPGDGDGAGGECVFLGRTRRDVHPEHGPLVRLRYEAYEPMAERVLRELATTAARRHGCHGVRVHHALGDVPPGAASVLVQVTCPHRAEAFAACRELIDALKATAPIWKREEWSDGTTWAPGTPVETPPGGAP